MRFRIPLQNIDAGMVTFPVLMVCTSMLVCVTTILSVVQIRFQIESNRGKYQVVDEAVKSVAIEALHDISGGSRLVEQEILVGNVDVFSSMSGSNIVTVQVTGAYSGAEDTVRFTYDTIRRKITDWKENSPPP